MDIQRVLKDLKSRNLSLPLGLVLEQSEPSGLFSRFTFFSDPNTTTECIDEILFDELFGKVDGTLTPFGTTQQQNEK